MLNVFSGKIPSMKWWIILLHVIRSIEINGCGSVWKSIPNESSGCIVSHVIEENKDISILGRNEVISVKFLNVRRFTVVTLQVTLCYLNVFSNIGHGNLGLVKISENKPMSMVVSRPEFDMYMHSSCSTIMDFISCEYDNIGRRCFRYSLYALRFTPRNVLLVNLHPLVNVIENISDVQ